MWILGYMRRDYFFIGLISRIAMLIVFIVINQTIEYNDASDIIFQALQELVHGRNPYRKLYTLAWGEGTFTQPLNYGPITLFLYLPALILPYWHNSLWIGMTVMINIYSYVIAEYVSRRGAIDQGMQFNATVSYRHLDPRVNQLLYYGGLFFWMVPVGTTCITVFIYGPILLTVLAFDQRDRPFIAGLCISLAAMGYQLIYLFVPIYVIYFLKKSPRFFIFFCIGCLPAFGILVLFFFWQYPSGILTSLFVYTSQMPYVKCPECGNNFDRFSVFSIPRLVYNFSGGEIQIGSQARIVMFIILGILCIFFLCSTIIFKLVDEISSKFYWFQRFQRGFFKNMLNPDFYVQIYIIIAVILFTLTTNYGQAHYTIFLFIPLLYYYQMKKPDFHKHVPIGANLKNWMDFEGYIRKFHQLPP